MPATAIPKRSFPLLDGKLEVTPAFSRALMQAPRCQCIFHVPPPENGLDRRAFNMERLLNDVVTKGAYLANVFTIERLDDRTVRVSQEELGKATSFEESQLGKLLPRMVQTIQKAQSAEQFTIAVPNGDEVIPMYVDCALDGKGVTLDIHLKNPQSRSPGPLREAFLTGNRPHPARHIKECLAAQLDRMMITRPDNLPVPLVERYEISHPEGDMMRIHAQLRMPYEVRKVYDELKKSLEKMASEAAVLDEMIDAPCSREQLKLVFDKVEDVLVAGTRAPGEEASSPAAIRLATAFRKWAEHHLREPGSSVNTAI